MDLHVAQSWIEAEFHEWHARYGGRGVMIGFIFYFFFAFAANRRMTAFCSEIGDVTLSGLIANLQRLRASTTTIDSITSQKLRESTRSPAHPGAAHQRCINQ